MLTFDHRLTESLIQERFSTFCRITIKTKFHKDPDYSTFTSCGKTPFLVISKTQRAEKKSMYLKKGQVENVTAYIDATNINISYPYQKIVTNLFKSKLNVLNTSHAGPFFTQISCAKL